VDLKDMDEIGTMLPSGDSAVLNPQILVQV